MHTLYWVLVALLFLFVATYACTHIAARVWFKKKREFVNNLRFPT
jgi:hypothetical protein